MINSKFAATQDSNQPTLQLVPQQSAPDLHGATLIDNNGKEIPITESMIQTACNDLIKAWEFNHSNTVATS